MKDKNNKNSLKFKIMFFLYATVLSYKVKRAWTKIPKQYRSTYKKVKKAVICGLLWNL